MPTKLRPTPFQGGTPSLGPASRKPTKAGDNGSSRASSNDTGAHHQPGTDGHGGEAAAHAPDRASLMSMEHDSARQSFTSVTMPLVIPDQVREHLPLPLVSFPTSPSLGPRLPPLALGDIEIPSLCLCHRLISACTMACEETAISRARVPARGEKPTAGNACTPGQQPHPHPPSDSDPHDTSGRS
jgi:hypothetical protein